MFVLLFFFFLRDSIFLRCIESKNTWICNRANVSRRINLSTKRIDHRVVHDWKELRSFFTIHSTLINNYDQFLYFYLPAPSYTPKILNFIRYFQKIPIWSPISSNWINAIQRVSRVFIKEKRKNLKRSNNNKLIKKKKSIFFFFFFFEIYTQKNPQTIFIFTTRSIASKPNVSK